MGYPLDESPFAEAVRKELRRARGQEYTCEPGKPETAKVNKGHPPQNSPHESYAVILEELDEFWEEVKKKREDRNPQKMLEELTQIGAMAQRAAEDLKLIEGH